MKNFFKGIWLYGLSGSGKTFLSKKILKQIRKGFVIDGDTVRELISFDLNYGLADRIKQNKRVLGIAKLVIQNGYFPIISSVYLDPKVFVKAKKNKIRVINVLRSTKYNNLKLANKKNVVGKSIKQPPLKCEIFANNGKKILDV